MKHHWNSRLVRTAVLTLALTGSAHAGAPSLVSNSGRPDHVLRIVEPSARSADVGLLVFGAMLGSLRLPVAKEEYAGTQVQAVPHPAHEGLREALEAEFAAWRALNGKEGTADRPPMEVLGNRFLLLFRDYSADVPAYDLQIETTVSHKPSSAAWFLPDARVTCSTTVADDDVKLAQWKEDDYALVRRHGQTHVADCIGRVRAAFDEWFKN